MSGTWKLKFWLFVLGSLFSVYMLTPTVLGLKDKRFAFEKQGKAVPWYYRLLPTEVINLGLDLRGGMYLEMEVGIDQAVTHKMSDVVSQINRYIIKDEEKYTGCEAVQIPGYRIRVEMPQDKQDLFSTDIVKFFGNGVFQFANQPFELFYEAKGDPAEARKQLFAALDNVKKFDGDVSFTREKKYLAVSFASSEQTASVADALSAKSLETFVNPVKAGNVGVMYLTPSDDFLGSLKADVVTQAEVSVRNRIDRFGVAEAPVSRTGSNRLVVELPGVKDPDQIIDIIRRTGKLEFRLVSNALPGAEVSKLVSEKTAALSLKNVYETDALAKLNEALKPDLPPDTELMFEIERDPRTNKVVQETPFLLEKQADVTGDMLASASVQTSQNMPYVSLSFNKDGAQRFGDVTSKNVGRNLAIVLDGMVRSAPVIKSPILGGEAMIELGLGRYEDLYKEAKTLVLVLNEGALPASLKVASKNIVGPSLGHDSIRDGLFSLAVGSLAVFFFMLVYYKVGGVIANIGLMVNMLFLFGILTVFQASLSLPGIAGIALTMGMAVDANVIIFERFREEKYLGKAALMVVDSGYGNAMSAIVDSNLTTFISGLVLFEFGTGPIKGFATTLMIGIVTTMLTAVVLTRLLYDAYVSGFKATDVRI